MSKSKNKKSRRLNKKRILIFLFIIVLLFVLTYKLFNEKITNIYIKGNDFLQDQEIIDIAGLKSYPNSINNISYNIKKKLETNKYILEANVKKKGFINKVYIEVKENYPLFFYQPENKTVLYNGEKIENKFSIPTVINQIPNTVYDKFVKNMQKVNKNILERISEIEYLPNDVDSERFFIIMNDGNYVYLTLSKYLAINKYLDMVKSFNNKKGILYLDSGEYFDIFDE